MRRGPFVVALLCGGDQRSQERDIALAKAIGGCNELRLHSRA